MSERVKNLIALSLIPQILILNWLRAHPEWVEQHYSSGLYLKLSALLRLLFGWIPFSVGDLCYTAFIVLSIRLLWKRRDWIKRKPLFLLRDLISGIAVVLLLFQLLWGLNYYRIKLDQKLGLDKSYTVEELEVFTQKLIAKSNQLQLELAGNDTLAVSIPYSTSEIYAATPQGFRALARNYPDLDYKPHSLKSSLYSLPLSYMGYSGYLNPFTHEAQVNARQIDFKYPVVSCHEVAHQLGYSAENEANFIGYLAAVHHPDPYFRYSGYIFALRYCLGELMDKDPSGYESLSKSINKGIFKNYTEVSEFWKRHETPLEPLFKNSFNMFLKANNQTNGIRSYNYVVGLLVNYYRANNL